MPIKREMIGKPLTSHRVEVSRAKVRELAMALGDKNPIYYDVEAARKAGYPDLPLPPTFPTLFNFWGRQPEDTLQEDLGLPKAGGLHGEEEYTYLAPIYPGDDLTGVTTLVNVEEKKGRSGSMEFGTLETVYTNQRQQEVLKVRTVVIIRTPVSE
ncbi:MAG TPA: MaoC family dehydratase N-terminal domain-containing protein [Chloroflexia bacterium]|nr:MaoC family dehydratase N-terminal domain-containing protein [Chloroflexia bacterium]